MSKKMAEMLATFDPILATGCPFHSDKAPAGTYDCAVCGAEVTKGTTNAGQSYAQTDYNTLARMFGVWFHADCVAKHGVSMLTDKQQIKATRQAHYDRLNAAHAARKATVTTDKSARRQAAKPVETTMTTTTTALAVTDEATIRSIVDKEYESKIMEAVSLITTLRSERDQARIDYSAMQQDYERIRQELAKAEVEIIRLKTQNVALLEEAATPVQETKPVPTNVAKSAAAQRDARKAARLEKLGKAS